MDSNAVTESTTSAGNHRQAVKYRRSCVEHAVALVAARVESVRSTSPELLTAYMADAASSSEPMLYPDDGIFDHWDEAARAQDALYAAHRQLQSALYLLGQLATTELDKVGAETSERGLDSDLAKAFHFAFDSVRPDCPGGSRRRSGRVSPAA